jgi:ribosomal protein L21
MATYAIVKTGGKQYKVAVGDIVKVEKLEIEAGGSVSLPVALVVDGADVTTDAAALEKVASPVRCSSTPRAPRSASTSSRTRPATTSARGTVSS